MGGFNHPFFLVFETYLYYMLYIEFNKNIKTDKL